MVWCTTAEITGDGRNTNDPSNHTEAKQTASRRRTERRSSGGTAGLPSHAGEASDKSADPRMHKVFFDTDTDSFDSSSRSQPASGPPVAAEGPTDGWRHHQV